MVVRDATKEALEKQIGLNPARQRNFLARLERYGVKAENFRREVGKEEIALEWRAYEEHLHRLAGEDEM